MQRIVAVPPSTAVTVPPLTTATSGSLVSQITVLMLAAPMPYVPCGSIVQESEEVLPGDMASDVELRETPVTGVFAKET